MGSLYYLYLTIKGSVQPNKITFFFWGLLPMIGFFAQYEQDISSVIWVTFAMGLIPFLIVGAAFFNPQAYWELRKLDYVLATMAVLSVVIWQATDNPNLALSMAIVADFIAGVPTIMKSYTHPFSEDWRPYALNVIGFGIGIFAVQSWKFEEYSFVVYLFCMTIIFTSIIFFRQKKLAYEIH